VFEDALKKDRLLDTNMACTSLTVKNRPV